MHPAKLYVHAVVTQEGRRDFDVFGLELRYIANAKQRGQRGGLREMGLPDDVGGVAWEDVRVWRIVLSEGSCLCEKGSWRADVGEGSCLAGRGKISICCIIVRRKNEPTV